LQLKVGFAQHGQVLSIRLNKMNPNKTGRRGKGGGSRSSCFVSYATAEEAAAAIAALNGMYFLGKRLTVGMSQDQGAQIDVGVAVIGAGGDLEDEDASALPTDFADRGSKIEAARERQREDDYVSSGAGLCTMCGQSGVSSRGVLGSRLLRLFLAQSSSRGICRLAAELGTDNNRASD
jgi:RNA recognition motif-containing protein